MSQDEAWSAGENDAIDTGDHFFGEPAYGEGMDKNDAFAVDRVFRYGAAFLQEQPGVALLGGVNFLVLSFITGMVGMTFAIAFVAAGEAGELDREVAEGLSNVASYAIQLMAWPFQQLVLAGIMVGAVIPFASIGVADLIEEDEAARVSP